MAQVEIIQQPAEIKCIKAHPIQRLVNTCSAQTACQFHACAELRARSTHHRTTASTRTRASNKHVKCSYHFRLLYKLFRSFGELIFHEKRVHMLVEIAGHLAVLRHLRCTHVEEERDWLFQRHVEPMKMAHDDYVILNVRF